MQPPPIGSSEDRDFPAFAVALGEEGSDPLVLHEGELVRVDEYAASGHYDRMDADLADVAALGVRVWRYGMPCRCPVCTTGPCGTGRSPPVVATAWNR